MCLAPNKCSAMMLYLTAAPHNITLSGFKMSKYQIVIPMSGYGERFRRAGYITPKPLIPVLGKPIIAHVLEMFPDENDVWFICNREHLENPQWNMAEILKTYCPSGHLCAIESHKQGPVYAVSQIFDKLDPSRPVVVNYCDFGWRWDWAEFKNFVEQSRCDGVVVSYTGFHPHMLRNYHYAYSKTMGDRVLEIQEKMPYTDEPMKEYASSGTYYFSTAALMRQAFEKTMARNDLLLNGEYYVSLAYRPLLEAGHDIRIYTLDKFFQWGTPEDLEEWLYQAQHLRLDAKKQIRPHLGGAVMMPMAGAGQRFVDAGYTTPKPLLKVHGQAMVLSAWRDLPEGEGNIFILRRDLTGLPDICQELEEKVPGSKLTILKNLTDGQARTCLAAMDQVTMDEPLTIGACDNGLRYDHEAFLSLWNQPEVDAIVWTARGLPGARLRPQSYGWVETDERDQVLQVSVKKPLSDPGRDQIVTGAFSFKKAAFFQEAATRMIARNGRINGEFYIDECLNDALSMGLNVQAFEVDAYICWGTPEELATYNYWREVFGGVTEND